MNCDEVRDLLGVLSDGELADAERRVVERHVGGCPACRDELASLRALSIEVRRAARYEPPIDLDARIRDALADAARASATPRAGVRAVFGGRVATHVGAALAGGAIAASLALVAVPPSMPGFAAEALSAHIGAMMTDQFATVVSSDSHTVKPWFVGKLDFSPPVVDLAEEGFPLKTGHVDYVMDRPVAVLDYERGHHHISLFVSPREAAPVSRQDATIRGYTVETWQSSAFSFAAVSDADPAAVRQFAALFRSAAASSDAPPPAPKVPPT